MFEPKEVFTTKHVRNKLPPFIIKGMLDSIMELKKKMEVDYLQTFDISVSPDKKTTYISHFQEEPQYNTQLIIKNVKNNYTGTVFIIDNKEYITVMEAEEY
ncbi:hypothetical protein KK120_18545 [Virgibacillus dakarensis]|nr:hypothetical protein [Virgibacillus dakarensis]